ncbi:MAG: proton-conducting transporter membrane subunit [Candidatus Omnitrophota bacterium]|nr:proton-conducting transporter membrane subunit [Candidatus Omnitrophota bacterium]
MSRFFAYPWFKLDALNGFVALSIGLFTVLTLIYSSRYIRAMRVQYYGCVILTAAASFGVVLANNLALLLLCWGFLSLTLYLLINMGDDAAASASAAKKALIMVGGTDALMLLGIGIVYCFSYTLQMDFIRLGLDNPWLVLAYLCIAAAAFAKAGSMPFHSWIPDCSEAAPLPVVAFLPASLDKLLGIYLLARISLDLFSINQPMNIFLMLVGAFTILAGVMMALVQHNLKRLLGYHAVSQVGYMVLGIGTGNPVGIAGGLFHMLNNALYKSCLFFGAGNVEYRAKTSDLDKLGGLSKFMPLTYISCLVASLAISGVPPLNGFVSKWMIYQGLISGWQMANGKWQMAVSVFCLAAAMFGSGLTLASFIKLLHAVFFSRPQGAGRVAQQEVPWQMWLPGIILAGICLISGVFAYQLPLKHLIFPVTGSVDFPGSWHAIASSLLIFLGLALGLWFSRLKGIRPVARQDTSFTGGEAPAAEENRVTGTDFYNTVREFAPLKAVYRQAEAGRFDLYEQGKAAVFAAGRFFQYLHNGILPTYLVWMLLGMIGLFLALLK